MRLGSPAKKVRKGIHTRQNVWDEAANLEVWRGGEKLDPGVNYFVLMLDQMEAPTDYSCEGHPGGFYITFNAPYAQALALKAAGFFSVEIEGEDYWSLRNHLPFERTEKSKVDMLRWAAEAWEKHFGPLDFGQVILST